MIMKKRKFNYINCSNDKSPLSAYLCGCAYTGSDFDDCMNIPYHPCVTKLRQRTQISSFINVRGDSNCD